MDTAIQSTADDAIRAKAVAVRAGYYQDPFVSAMLGTAQPQHHRTVQPIIKRGTHARVACMDRAIYSFLKLVPGSCQIVVLGAGKDSSFFRHFRVTNSGHHHRLGDSSHPHQIRWFDIDHDVVIREKVSILDREDVFQSKVSRRSASCFECLASNDTSSTAKDSIYYLVSFDLRGDMLYLLNELVKHGFDSKTPTLFLMECFQMYLPESSTVPLLKGLGEMAPGKAFLAMYEPILGSDSFGHVMESNLIAAQVVQRDSCLVTTRTLHQHLTKISKAEFRFATGCHMWDAYETVLSPDQRQRANACEFLDEIEEWILIMRHYCLIVASNSNDLGAGFCAIGKDSSPMGFWPDRCETIPNK